MFIFILLVSLTAAIASLYFWLRGKEGGERTDSYRTMTLFFGIVALVCALLLVPGEFRDNQRVLSGDGTMGHETIGGSFWVYAPGEAKGCEADKTE